MFLYVGIDSKYRGDKNSHSLFYVLYRHKTYLSFSAAGAAPLAFGLLLPGNAKDRRLRRGILVGFWPCRCCRSYHFVSDFILISEMKVYEENISSVGISSW